MSSRDMDLLIRRELDGDRPVEDGYRAFLGSLDGALSSTAKELGAMRTPTSWRTPPCILGC